MPESISDLKGRFKEICVSRLRSFPDYSNVSVKVCYEPADGENIDEVYKRLVTMAESYVAQHLEILKLRDVQDEIERDRQWISSLLKEAEALREKLEAKGRELADLIHNLRGHIEEFEASIEKSGLKEKIKKLLGR